jgi:hypothetical protein
VKALRPCEKRKFLRSVPELEEGLAVRKRSAKNPVRWADAETRRRRIFGGQVLPNLVLMARQEERF